MAALPQTVSNASAALKVLYSARKLKELTYPKNPFYAMVKKTTGFTGKQKDCPIWYGGNAGGSHTFSNARANKRPGLFKAFSLTRVRDYNLGNIEVEAIKASRDNAGAFLKLSQGEVDLAIKQLTNNLGISMFRNSGSARGQVGSINSTALTLLNPEDVVNFEVGQLLVQSTADGTSGALGTGSSEVTKVDRRAGILYAANWTNFTANDYLFRDGDFGTGISGVDSWCPTTTPTTGDSFFGVDRSTDTRLYGQYHDGSNQDILDAILDLDTKLAREGAETDLVFVNPGDFNAIRKRLQGDVVYEKVSPSDKANVSFNGIHISGMSGDLKVVADRNCPINYGLVTQMDSWEFECLDLPGLQDTMMAGEALRIVEDADAVEFRTCWYGQLGNHAPAFSGRVKFR